MTHLYGREYDNDRHGDCQAKKTSGQAKKNNLTFVAKYVIKAAPYNGAAYDAEQCVYDLPSGGTEKKKNISKYSTPPPVPALANFFQKKREPGESDI